MKIQDMFWKRYNEADELRQREILKKLTGVEENKDYFFKHMTLTLFKSYIDDALEFGKQNKTEEVNK